MRAIHAALSGYTCTIEDIVTAENRTAARMTFKGIHQGAFFGVEATGRKIAWAGAAFFETDDRRLTTPWVLGDIDAVKRQLGAPADTGFAAD